MTDWRRQPDLIAIGRAARVGFTRAARSTGLVLLLSGCIASETGGPPRVAPLPPSVPRVTGVAQPSNTQHAQLIRAFGGEYAVPAAEKLINETLVRLVQASDQPNAAYRVTILNAPAVNAFALPDGNLFVTRGLLALANDTSEIAGVLAHEMAHVIAQHASERAELEQRSQLLSKVATDVLNNPEAGLIVRAQSRLSIASFSRQQELEADTIGVKVMAKAGYDPYGATRFLVALGRNSALRGANRPGASRLDFLSTHPSTPERVSRALLAARQVGAPGFGEKDRDVYFRAIDGIAFGDNPNSGSVRGRRYVHPGLGVAWTAPDGYALERNGSTVTGTSSVEGQAFRFDGIQLPISETLVQHLSTSIITGAVAENVEATTLAGAPAVTGLLRGQDLTFRVGLIQMGPLVYRMIFAARGLTPELDRVFLDAIRSFRRPDDADLAITRPARLTLVAAEPGDTVESIARRMTLVDRPQDVFAIVNGIERNAALKPGMRYKIVVPAGGST